MKRGIAVFAFVLFAAAGAVEEIRGAAPDPALVAEGKQVYEVNCLVCHGPTGKGDGQAAAALDPKPRNFTDAKYMATRSVEALRNVITEGGQAAGMSPIMIGWKAILKPEQIKAVLAFVQSLAPNPAYVRKGQEKASDKTPVD